MGYKVWACRTLAQNQISLTQPTGHHDLIALHIKIISHYLSNQIFGGPVRYKARFMTLDLLTEEDYHNSSLLLLCLVWVLSNHLIHTTAQWGKCFIIPVLQLQNNKQRLKTFSITHSYKWCDPCSQGNI